MTNLAGLARFAHQDGGPSSSPGVAGLADLHLHTLASDGMLQAGEIFERARRAGMRAIAITDHDTVAAHLAGGFPAEGPEIIPGIELSCESPHGEIHILGYHFEPRHAPLLERLEALRKNRVKRLDRMIAALATLGIRLDEAFVEDTRGRPGSIGRPHVARELVRIGAVSSFREAFDRYLGTHGAAYIPHENGLDCPEAIALIAAAGGVSSIAHPGKMLETAPDDFLRDLKAMGLTGIETHHPSHNANQVKNCQRLAAKLRLIETGGSDFHADSDIETPGTYAGRHCGVGESNVGYAVVSQLREVARGGDA